LLALMRGCQESGRGREEDVADVSGADEDADELDGGCGWLPSAPISIRSSEVACRRMWCPMLTADGCGSACSPFLLLTTLATGAAALDSVTKVGGRATSIFSVMIDAAEDEDASRAMHSPPPPVPVVAKVKAVLAASATPAFFLLPDNITAPFGSATVTDRRCCVARPFRTRRAEKAEEERADISLPIHALSPSRYNLLACCEETGSCATVTAQGFQGPPLVLQETA
jgi:hypothetical protein